MGVSVASMIAQARVDSGLRNNRLFSDTQIAGFLTDALSDLRDKMIVRFAYWFKAEYPFTLAGGAGGNILDLSEVPDLEMIQGLNLIDATGNPFTVDMLGSFAERNQYAANWPFATGGSFYGAVGRKYWPDGNDLEVLPASNAGGDYVLIYTPQAQTLSPPVTRTFDAEGSDQPGTAGPLNAPSWLLSGDFETSDVGGTITPNLDAPNDAWNVEFDISEVFSANAAACTPDPTAIGSFTLPADGTFSITSQPAGTIGELPDALTPWSYYLVLLASIRIRTGRRQPLGDLSRQLERFERRIVALTKQRSEGVRQAPVTRTNYGAGRGGFWDV